LKIDDALATVLPINDSVNGRVWICGDDEYQMDVKTASRVHDARGCDAERARPESALLRSTLCDWRGAEPPTLQYVRLRA
jgi:hypothetical protein